MPNIERLMQFADIFDCEEAELLTSKSSRPEDQARRIQQLLSSLDQAGREAVMNLVDRLAERPQRA